MTNSACSHSHTIPGGEGDWCPECRKLVKPKPSDSPYPKLAIGSSAPIPPNSAAFSDSPYQDWHFVHVYKSHGSQYFRYVWGVGHKISGVRHIPGGNVRNPIAQNRAEQVKSAIGSGLQPDDIRKLIDRWTW